AARMRVDLPRRGFFFSSRRRHTRWPRDWSSDVCSSDLLNRDFPRAHDQVEIEGVAPEVAVELVHRGDAGENVVAPTEEQPFCTRSEERRVGKECRCRWAAEQLKKGTKRRLRLLHR